MLDENCDTCYAEDKNYRRLAYVCHHVPRMIKNIC